MSAIPVKLPEAMRFHAAGEIGKAQVIYSELLSEHPTHPELLFLLGTSYFQQQQFTQARQYLERATRAEPKNSKHYYRLAEVCLAENQPEAAVVALAKLMGQLPDDQMTYQAILDLTTKHDLNHVVISTLQPAAKKNPGSLFINALLARLLLEKHANAESVPYFEKVLKIIPGQGPDFMECYIRALHRSNRMADAHRIAEESLKRFPDARDLWVVLGNMYGAEGNYDKQFSAFEQAFKRNPGQADIENSYALMQFLQTDFAEGFMHYRARFKIKDQIYFPFPLPEWQGESLTGKKIVLWMEQGIGDILMFAGYLPWLLAQKPAEVLLLAHPTKLIPLFQRAFPEITTLPLFTNHPETMWQHYDVHVPMGELMHYGMAHYTPSEHPPHMKVDVEKVARLREKYQQKAPGKKLVGLAWHTVNPFTGYMRNIPLEQFLPLFRLPNVQFISLQYAHPETMESFNERITGKHLLIDDSFSSYDDADALLAQIGAMDEVITIQNATAHMAGSIGKKTSLLLSRASDWRWGKEREDNRWYSSVRVVRQEETYRWDKTIERLKKELEN